MPIGLSDLKNVIRLPGTWDTAYLQKWALKDGTTFDRIIADFGAALTIFNRGLLASYWAMLLRVTEDITARYAVGTSGVLKKMAEHARPDPVRGDTTGHMLPLHDFGGALGWTYLALRRAHRGILDEDIRALVQRGGDTWEVEVLTRLFKMEAETVGNTGKSVPFADGGTADADYIPPSFQGKNFASSHNHFLRYTADATGRSSSIQAAANHLREHGHPPPYEWVIPEADIASWAGQSEFRKPERGILATAGVETRALVPEEMYLGVIEANEAWFRVKSTPRLPTAYAGAFKAYGQGDARSPLAARTEEGFPLGLALVGQIDQFPLQDAVAYLTFGVGVGNRTAGVGVYYAASGAYITPTIS